MPKFLCTFTVPGPAEDMLREVGELFDLHELAVEDTVLAHQRRQSVFQAGFAVG